MARVALLSSVLENVTVYRLWQATHAEQKLVPVRRHNDLGSARRVLDVGCGPGINTALFTHAEEYVGLDWNEDYIAYARRRYGREFVATDICTFEPDRNRKFDFIFVNSFFHHIDTPGTRTILRRLHELLSPGGHVHIVDLVLPDHPSPARTLARWDRGEYPRPLEQWRELFAEVFETVVFEPFPIKLFGVTCWSKVYFKGRRKS